jgi:hypothetical protein
MMIFYALSRWTRTSASAGRAMAGRLIIKLDIACPPKKFLPIELIKKTLRFFISLKVDDAEAFGIPVRATRDFELHNLGVLR